MYYIIKLASARKKSKSKLSKRKSKSKKKKDKCTKLEKTNTIISLDILKNVANYYKKDIKGNILDYVFSVEFIEKKLNTDFLKRSFEKNIKKQRQF